TPLVPQWDAARCDPRCHRRRSRGVPRERSRTRLPDPQRIQAAGRRSPLRQSDRVDHRHLGAREDHRRRGEFATAGDAFRTERAVSRPMIVPEGSAVRQRTFGGTSLRQILVPAISLAALLVLWGLAIALFDIPKYVIPSPLSVIDGIIEERADLASEAVATSSIAALGLLLSIAV